MMKTVAKITMLAGLMAVTSDAYSKPMAAAPKPAPTLKGPKIPGRGAPTGIYSGKGAKGQPRITQPVRRAKIQQQGLRTAPPAGTSSILDMDRGEQIVMPTPNSTRNATVTDAASFEEMRAEFSDALHRKFEHKTNIIDLALMAFDTGLYQPEQIASCIEDFQSVEAAEKLVMMAEGYVDAVPSGKTWETMTRDEQELAALAFYETIRDMYGLEAAQAITKGTTIVKACTFNRKIAAPPMTSYAQLHMDF